MGKVEEGEKEENCEMDNSYHFTHSFIDKMYSFSDQFSLVKAYLLINLKNCSSFKSLAPHIFSRV